MRFCAIGSVATTKRPVKGMSQSARGAAGTIRAVSEARATTPPDGDAEVVAQLEQSRLLMMRRVKAMSIEERLALFDRLSRRVTWARTAKRIK